MHAINRDRTIDRFRDAILAALDETAHDVFAGANELPKAAGASDADLPELFRLIDAHADRLAARHGFALVDWDGPQGAPPPRS